MSQIKLAAMSMMPLMFLCSICTAQQPPSDCGVTMQPPAPSKAEVYGPFVPYAGTPLAMAPTKCEVSAAPPASKSEFRKDVISTAPVSPAASTSATISPTCEPPVPRKDEVYGAFVAYTGPLLGVPPRCVVAPAAGNPPPSQTIMSESPALDLSAAKGPMLPADNIPPAEPESAYVRVPPLPRAVTGESREVRPFHSIAVGFKADTLGLGVELATPVSHSFNLRSSVNFFAFTDPFSIDGISYNARLHLKSSETTLDWFLGHGLHISPGVLYMKNSMSAATSIAPGQTFLLGSQTYINSVDDPVSGSSSVIYPHNFAPMLLIGVGNIIPRSDRHFSVPFELGAAYTGAPLISVALNGTACTANGCVNFVQKSIQTNLKQEIDNLNEGLKRYPFFPIVSLGVAYHF